MKENRSFFQTPLGIFSIILFIISIIYVIYINKKYSDEYLKEVKQNWNDYRCKASVIPIAGIVGPEGTTTTNNLYDCFNEKVHGIFKTLMAPFVSIINVIMNILDQLIENINGIKKVIDFMRESITSIVEGIYNEIRDLMLKLEKVFDDFIKVFKDIYTVISSLVDLGLDAFYSIVSLGNWFKHSFFCFDENTKIKLSNNEYSFRHIKDIKVGDILDDNTIVECILKLSTKGVIMYNYFGVIVSGSHLVYESGINKWIRVEESKYSKRIKKYNKSYIYSLITSNAKIPVISSIPNTINEDIVFADWYEISDEKIKTKIQDMTLSILNNKSKDKKIEIEPRKTFYNKKSNIWWGFNGCTEINMYKNENKKICDIKIGDKLRDGNKVLAIVENLTPKDIKLYRCKNGGKIENDIIVSGSQIIYDKTLNKWIKISVSNNYEEYHKDKYNLGTKNMNKLYHIITENNKICINDEVFTDFYQLPPNKSKIIDRFVENKINI